MAQQLAAFASAQQQQITGRIPKAVTGVLNDDTLVLTLYDALTPGEQALARHEIGAAQVEALHKQLFSTSMAPMRREIKRVTGRAVREMALDVASGTGAIIRPFTNGTLVQVYLLRSEEESAISADGG